MLAASASFLVTLVPWIRRSSRRAAVGHSKFNPLDATPSLTAVRDLVGALAFGENGGTASAAGRWLILLVSSARRRRDALLRRGWMQRPAVRNTVRCWRPPSC